MKQLEVNLSQLKDFASGMAQGLKGREVIALSGELGAGKTTFTQALAATLGVTSVVSSPTFTLAKEYTTQTGWRLYHYDWYRLHHRDEIKALGIAELWLKPATLTVIEWPERAWELLPPDTIRLHFEHVDAETRRITIYP